MTQVTLGIAEIEERIRQRFPFLLIDRVVLMLQAIEILKIGDAIRFAPTAKSGEDLLAEGEILVSIVRSR